MPKYPSTPTQNIARGDKVQVQGLATSKQYNGSRGTVVKVCSGAESRQTVRLFQLADGIANNTVLRVRPLHLIYTPDQDSSSQDQITPLVQLLDNDLQPRDWLHRGGFDPPESFNALWRIPIKKGSQGFKESPPCQCLNKKCTMKTAGGYVTDAVICWQCKSYFHLNCLGGPQKIMGNSSGIAYLDKDKANQDHRTNIEEWTQCPLCNASLGVISMPYAFQMMVALSSKMENKEIAAELDFAMKKAAAAKAAGNKDAAIHSYTRAINCANVIRSKDSSGFTMGIHDNFIKAYIMRAKLEKKTKLAKRLLTAYPTFSRHEKTALPSRTNLDGTVRIWNRFRCEEDFHKSFATRNTCSSTIHEDASHVEIASGDLFSSSGTRTLQLCGGRYILVQRTGMGALNKHKNYTDLGQAGSTQIFKVNKNMNKLKLMPQQLKQRSSQFEWQDQRGAGLDFKQMDSERRGCNLWSTYRPSTQVGDTVSVMDMRYCCHTVTAAKDYWKIMYSRDNEMKNMCTDLVDISSGGSECIQMISLQSEDDCLVTNGQVIVHGVPMVHTCCLFRVGRMCGKVFVGINFDAEYNQLCQQNPRACLIERLQVANNAIANVRQALLLSVDRSGKSADAGVDGVGIRVGAATAKSMPSCSACGLTLCKTFRCGKCKLIRYCSVICQKNDWRSHKKKCCKPNVNV